MRTLVFLLYLFPHTESRFLSTNLSNTSTSNHTAQTANATTPPVHNFTNTSNHTAQTANTTTLPVHNFTNTSNHTANATTLPVHNFTNTSAPSANTTTLPVHNFTNTSNHTANTTTLPVNNFTNTSTNTTTLPVHNFMNTSTNTTTLPVHNFTNTSIQPVPNSNSPLSPSSSDQNVYKSPSTIQSSSKKSTNNTYIYLIVSAMLFSILVGCIVYAKTRLTFVLANQDCKFHSIHQEEKNIQLSEFILDETSSSSSSGDDC
jgi:hypothetical protein